MIARISLVVRFRVLRAIEAEDLVLKVDEPVRLIEKVVSHRTVQPALAVATRVQPGVDLGFGEGRRRVAEVDQQREAENLALGIGILELACTIIYVIPRTAVLGAILLTGYLGGAILTHLRVGEPIFLQVIFGVLIWGGLYLRDPRLRVLIPLRSLPT